MVLSLTVKYSSEFCVRNKKVKLSLCRTENCSSARVLYRKWCILVDRSCGIVISHRGPPTRHPKLCACSVTLVSVGLSAWGDVSNPCLRIPDIPGPPPQLAALHNFISLVMYLLSDARCIIVNAYDQSLLK